MDSSKATALEPLLPAFFRGGHSKSSGYRACRDGLFPRVVHVGRSAFVPRSEVDRLVAARIAGASDDALRALVTKMLEERARVAAEMSA